MLQLAKRGIKAGLRISKITPSLARLRGGAHIIMLHGVGIDGLSAEDFRRFLVWLKQDFDVVSLGSVVDGLASGDQSMAHCSALTFDDGLQNHYTVAYPILKELDVPATFFVCPELIDAGRRIWTHEARFRLSFLKQNNSDVQRNLETFGFRSGDVVEWMKTLALDVRMDVERWLESASSGFSYNEAQNHASELMTWEEIKSLDPGLITIGSHTLTHPILPLVPDDVAEKEILGSAERLRTELDRAIDFFCYPNGNYSPKVLEIVMRGYRAGITTTFGKNRPGTNLAALLRVSVNSKLSDMAWKMYRAAG